MSRIAPEEVAAFLDKLERAVVAVEDLRPGPKFVFSDDDPYAWEDASRELAAARRALRNLGRLVTTAVVTDREGGAS